MCESPREDLSHAQIFMSKLELAAFCRAFESILSPSPLYPSLSPYSSLPLSFSFFLSSFLSSSLPLFLSSSLPLSLSPSLPPSLSLFLSLTNTHEQLSEKERGEAGVTEDMIRVSVGYEDIEDIQSDFEAGFAAAKQ